MTVLTQEELQRKLIQLQLITPDQWSVCLHDLRNPVASVPEILEQLEKKNGLTSYQVQRIVKGEADDLVVGNYILHYQNASGSFARVFRASSRKTRQMVGLKLLRLRWTKDPQTVALFHREAEFGMKLKHPNIVPIYDVGCDGTRHYLTMEFVEGGNLKDFIAIRKKLTAVEALRCALDMSEGLAYALKMGVTHRDLKLSNVLMSTDGVAKLVDFGLATIGGNQLAGVDSFQRALEYSALENGTNAPDNDPRTDLFFLGAIVYELLTGTPPYPRTRNRDERRKITRYSNIRPIRSLDPNIPRDIQETVERLLKIDPNNRYQSAKELGEDIKGILKSLGNEPEVDNKVTPLPPNKPSAPDRGLPTVMCIENRPKQQDMLREYLTKHGFRVLVLSDMQRGLARLSSNPPDCIVLMGDSIGDDVFAGFQESVRLTENGPVISIVILGKHQHEREDRLTQTDTARVLTQPVTLRELRKQIHLSLQRRQKQLQQLREEFTDSSDSVS